MMASRAPRIEPVRLGRERAARRRRGRMIPGRRTWPASCPSPAPGSRRGSPWPGCRSPSRPRPGRWIEEQHVLGAQRGQRAGQLAVAVADGRALGRTRSPARRPRSGRTARWTSARAAAGAGRRWRMATPRRSCRTWPPRAAARQPGSELSSWRPSCTVLRSGQEATDAEGSPASPWRADCRPAPRVGGRWRGPPPAPPPVGPRPHHPLLGYGLADTPSGGRSFQVARPTLGAWT